MKMTKPNYCDTIAIQLSCGYSEHMSSLFQSLLQLSCSYSEHISSLIQS